MIYSYLPKELLPENFEDLEIEEFLELLAAANYVRDLKIEDIKAAVMMGIDKAMSAGE